MPGSGIGAWRSGLGVGLGVLTCGFESFGGISVLLCMGVVERVVGHVWRVGERSSCMAQWVRDLTGDLDMRVRTLCRANSFAVHCHCVGND